MQESCDSRPSELNPGPVAVSKCADMSPKQEYLDSDQEEFIVEPITTGGNIDATVFQIRNILEEPDAKSYTTLELYSKLFCAFPSV
jgi:hypothetical protein